MSTHWKAIPEKGNGALIRFLIWVNLTFGRRAIRVLLIFIVAYYTTFSPTARKASITFLTRAKGRPASWYDAFKHFLTFATVATDRVHFMAGNMDQFDIEIEGQEVFEQYGLDGAVLVTSHLGSFDVMRALAHIHPNLRLRILLDVQHNANIVTLLNSLSPVLAKDIIDARTYAPDLALQLNEAVEQQQLVGIMGDRVNGDERSISLPFMGGEACFPENLWQLAAVLRKPVIHCTGVYLGGNKYKVMFSLIDTNLGGNRKDRRGKIERAVSQYVAELENTATQYPYNWFNFYSFWQAPKNEPGPTEPTT